MSIHETPQFEQQETQKPNNFDFIVPMLEQPEVVVFDVDGTLYPSDTGYQGHLEDIENFYIAHAMVENGDSRFSEFSESNFSKDESGNPIYDQETAKLATKLITSIRYQLSQDLVKQKVLNKEHRIRKTDLVTLSPEKGGFGLSREYYNFVRENYPRPEDYIQPDIQTVNLLQERLDNGQRVILASNSPSKLVIKILKSLGASDELISQIEIHGPEKVSKSKPHPEYYQELIRNYNLKPQTTLMVGNESQNDGVPAAEVGMGSIIVKGPSQIDSALEFVSQLEQFNIDKFLENIRPESGEVKLVGVLGRAGAGKSSFARNLEELAISNGISTSSLGADTFFKASSKDRAEWLEGKDAKTQEFLANLANGSLTQAQISNLRANMDLWWDQQAMLEALKQLKEGSSYIKDGVYSQTDKEKLSGKVDIQPNLQQGHLIVVEGVPLARMVMINPEIFDKLVYIHSSPATRKDQVYGRDIQKRGPEAALARWQITEAYEGLLYPKVFESWKRNKASNLPLTVLGNKPSDNHRSFDNYVVLPGQIPSM